MVKKRFKYFNEYNDNDDNIKPLCIILPKTEQIC